MSKSTTQQVLFVLFLILSIQAQSQILNVESMRKINKDTKWSGNTNLNLQLIENKNSFVLVSNRTRLQYKNNKHLYLIISDYNFKESNSNKIVSKGIQHLRYNYKVNETIRAEAFIQNQFDEISKIKYRRLIGIGPRFKLNNSENYKFYAGTLIMKEWEYINSDIENTRNNDLRLSAYFSFSLFPKDGISIVSTTYFQPKINAFSDLRWSNDSRVTFKIIKNLAFNVQLTITYDNYPALGIPKTQYKLVNGLIYTFG